MSGELLSVNDPRLLSLGWWFGAPIDPRSGASIRVRFNLSKDKYSLWKALARRLAFGVSGRPRQPVGLSQWVRKPGLGSKRIPDSYRDLASFLLIDHRLCGLQAILLGGSRNRVEQTQFLTWEGLSIPDLTGAVQ